MAAAPPSPLECPICAELYDDFDHEPKLLTCYHMLCLSCIIRLAKGITVQCPNKCKQTTALPNLSHEEQEGIKTDKETITKRAKKLQCCFYIDVIRENEQFQQLVLAQSETKLCLEHHKPLNVWCKVCQQVVCVKCMFTLHKEHNHDLLENVAEIFIAKINETAGQIRIQTEKLRSEKANRIKQQHMRDIDRQFEEIQKDFTKMLNIKKQAVKTQVTLAIDEYLNIQLASLDSLHSAYQQAINSDDLPMKMHVSSSSELDKRLNLLMKCSQITDEHAAAQIQQYSSSITQTLHRALHSIETPTLSQQLPSAVLKSSTTAGAALPPKLFLQMVLSMFRS